MATITTRAAKGAALSFAEMDANLNALNTDKAETTAVTAAVNAPQSVTTRNGSGTLVIGEAYAIVEVNSASAVTITIPPNSSVAFVVGTVIEIVQIGAGTVTAAAGAGVTLNGTAATSGQWKSVFLRKRATDTWIAQ